jgi:glycosyltransferase involved in cell wall biosynthesis
VPRPLGSHRLGFPLLDRAGRGAAASLASRAPVVVANGGNCRADDVVWLHYVHAAYAPDAPRWFFRRLVRYDRAQAMRDELAAVQRARVVIANSGRTRRDAVELLGADEGRVEVVYYGIEPERFRPPSDDERAEARRTLGIDGDAPAVAFVGALGDRRKGFDTLFAAWRALAAEPGWDATLLVVGTGAEAGAWERRAREAGLGARMRFLGFREDVGTVLAACDALVSPTRYEAYGLAVHEALCRGLPALVSRDAGVAERYPEEMRALLIDDPDAAEELRRRLVDWRARREEHRAAAIRLSAELRGWTWDDMAARIVDIVGERG